MPPLSRPIRQVVLIASVLVLASAVVLSIGAVGIPLLKSGEKPGWLLFGFEIVTIVASVLGVLLAKDRFRSGPGLGLACIAATILVASGLGWQSVGRQLGGVSLLPVLAFRVGAAGLLGAAGAWTVLSRRPGATAMAMRGALLLAPVALAGAALLRPGGRRVIAAAIGESPAIQFVAVTLGFLGATALIAAGAHLIIRAFELGRTDEPTSRSA